MAQADDERPATQASDDTTTTTFSRLWRLVVGALVVGATLFCIAPTLLRVFIVEAYKIPAGSMRPTLHVGDHLLIYKLAYSGQAPPARGDVIVFEFPRRSARAHLQEQPASLRGCIDARSLERSSAFIKRVVAVGGDTVELRDNRLLLNGEAVPHEVLEQRDSGEFLHPSIYIAREEIGAHTHKIRYMDRDSDFGPVEVRPEHVFVMGDNRDSSSDSRCWGQVPVDHVEGEATFIWMFGRGGGAQRSRQIP